MAINFTVGEFVIANQAYTKKILPTIIGIRKQTLGSLGVIGSNPSEVLETGMTPDSQSFIRLRPQDTTSPAFRGGKGTIIYFPDDAILNNSLERTTAYLDDKCCVKALNLSGSLITKGALVYQIGFDTSQQLPTIDLASGANPAMAAVLGLASADIPDTECGSIIFSGSFEGLNTSIFSNVGDRVFLGDPAGTFSNVAGTVEALIGRVLSIDSVNGSISLVQSLGGSGSGAMGATGLKGCTGLQGETGLGTQGVTGLALGATGIQGVTGILGIDGQTGIQGVQGTGGVTGLEGLQGLTGLALGSTGLQGDQGATGVGGGGCTGIQGETGLGLPGNTGLQGIQGDTGIKGCTGIQGLGSTGVQGETGIQGTTGAAGGGTGLQGETGIKGCTGIQGLGETGLQGIQGQTGIGGGGGGSGASLNTIRFTVGTAATTDSSTVLPASARVMYAAFDVTTAYQNPATISVGRAGSTAAYMQTWMIDAETIGFNANFQDTDGGSAAIRVTVSSTPGFGAGTCIIWYTNPDS
jgi:hypothetical protein